MILLLEDMLNMLRKKLVNKSMHLFLGKCRVVFFYILFIFSLLCNFSICNADVRQGEIFSDSLIENIDIGMTKSKLLEIFGQPRLIIPYNIDCWCYYYYYCPNDINLKIERKFLLFYFNNSFLNSYFIDN